MNLAYLVVLGAYVIHSVAMHRHDGPATTEQDSQIHRGMPAPLMPITMFFAWQAFSTPTVMGLLTLPATWGTGTVVLLLLLVSQWKKRRRGGEVTGLASTVFYFGGGLLQTALLALACYIAYLNDVLGRSLFDPKWVILGLIAGHLVFGVSLIFSHRSLDTLRDIAAYVLDPRPLGRFAGQSPRQLFACLDVSLIEELVYRVAAQGVLLVLTGSPWISIVVTALVFSMVHRHFFYNHVVDSLEFLGFSLLLGVLYYTTGSFMLVVMVHLVRNFEIVYFDHATRPDSAAHWRCDFQESPLRYVR